MTQFVYLAGKVRVNGWREYICNHRGVISGDATTAELYSWPVIHSIVKDTHITGPYGVSCDHGCFHGENTHGFGETTCFSGSGVIQQQQVMQACLGAIQRSSSIFVWIDAKDCYGTLMEVGYAKALGKFIYTAVSPEMMIGFERSDGGLGHHDLWFLEQMSDAFVVRESAVAAFNHYYKK